MPIKRTAKEEFKRIMNGMLYHCMDLTSFMAKNMDDPYFHTEEGRRMIRYAMDICSAHAQACILFMRDDKQGDEDGDKIDIEQMLKDLL